MEILGGLIIVICIIAILRIKEKEKRERQLALEMAEYKKLESSALAEIGIRSWDTVPYWDDRIVVKSRQALEKYNDIKYFKDAPEKLEIAERIIERKSRVANSLRRFLDDNNHKSNTQYPKLVQQINTALQNARAFRVCVEYVSSAGNVLGNITLSLGSNDINKFHDDPSLLMGKAEYSKYLKEQQKEELNRKHQQYYERVNAVIDYANENKDMLVIKRSSELLDSLIAQLFDRTVNSIKKIKTIDSEEWSIIGDFISYIKNEVEAVINKNRRIVKYYESEDFQKIKNTCEVLMSSQREFNDYIAEKVQTISKLFGTRTVRNETINADEYAYIRPYKKTITPFTAELSAAVFASAENNPMEYLVKNFYPNKQMYPEQIQKLHLLLEEIETLREAKQIIENYKAEYQQYLGDVPAFIMEQDEAGFYARLGFTVIDESVLTVEYKFSYTSGGGMAQRSFTIPMTEETIVELIRLLESKLTAAAFAKEQRILMTKKLRTFIKTRDNFTCCSCGNSTHIEPNLLLEIDHIIPVARGGCTVEGNLQTLCWKCNRAKSDKIIL